MNSGDGSPNKRKSPLISPRQLPPTVVAGAAASPAKQGSITTATGTKSSGGCCISFKNCLVMGSTVKRNHHLAVVMKLQHQVEELEKEMEKQKEMHQNNLRECVEKAKENGFLDKTSKDENMNDNQEELITSPHLPKQISTPVYHQSVDLCALQNLANINGWYIHPHEIEVYKKVGEGTTADIYVSTWRGLEVAVKCIFPDFFESNEHGINFFAQEVEILSRQHHPFVLGLMGACLDPPHHAWVVTEFLSTTLKEWLHGPGTRRSTNRAAYPLPLLRERVRVALEIAQGLQYLHQQTPMVIHRDLKPSNVFMDNAMHVRVADFGHARFLTDAEKALTGETGTYVYMAPEVIRCAPYDEKCDIYSFGIILNELITGEYPYIQTDYSPAKIALEVGLGNIRPALPEHEEQLEELIELTQLCWDEDASTRPYFPAITTTLKMILNRFDSVEELMTNYTENNIKELEN